MDHANARRTDGVLKGKDAGIVNRLKLHRRTQAASAHSLCLSGKKKPQTGANEAAGAATHAELRAHSVERDV